MPTPGVLDNDSDPEGASITAALATGVTDGDLTFPGDGSFVYSPSANFNGTATFTYRANDGLRDSDPATVTITVNSRNDAPVAQDDATSTNEDTLVTFDVSANDSDPDFDALTVTAATIDGGLGIATFSDGSITFDPRGAYDFIPSGGSENVVINYTIADGNGGSAQAVLRVQVSGINDLAVANDDSYVISEDDPTILDVLANDFEPDNELTFYSVGEPDNGGQVTQNGNGMLAFDPTTDFDSLDAGASITSTFTYRVPTGSWPPSEATVQVVVNGVNDAPRMDTEPLTATRSENQAAVFSVAIATDPENHTFTLSDAVITTGLGSVAIDGDTFTYDPGDDYLYLKSGETEQVTVQYTLTDESSASSDWTAQINLLGRNTAAVAVDDSGSTTQDDAIVIDVLANDSDADGDELTVSQLGSPRNPNNQVRGTVTDNGDGTVTYDPNDTLDDLNEGESVDITFTYRVTDGSSYVVEATVTITVSGLSDAPVANGDAMTVLEGRTQTRLSNSWTRITTNDTDAEDGSYFLLEAVLVDSPAHAQAFTLNLDGSFSYTHDGSETGSDSFTYSARDTDGNLSAPATVSISVTLLPDAPVAVADSIEVEEGGTISPGALNVLDNDTDDDTPHNELEAVLSTGPSNASSFTLNSDGTFSYTHDGGQSTQDSFRYRAKDSDNQYSDFVTVSITITSSNDVPVVAINTSPRCYEGPFNMCRITAAELRVEDADEPAPQTIVFTVVTPPALGELLLWTGTTLVATSSWTQADIDAEAVRYRHDGSETEEDSFEFTVSDGEGGEIAATRFDITVIPINDTPVLENNAGLTLDEGASGPISETELLATDVDINPANVLTYTVTVVPARGELLLDGLTVIARDETFTQEDIGNDRVSYRHFGGDDLSDSFTFRLSDGATSLLAAPFEITVNPVNDPPVAQADSWTIDEGGSIPGWNVLINDDDSDNLQLTAELVSSPDHASSFSLASTGAVSYTHDGSESTFASFTYRAWDGADYSEITSVFITITPVNDPPIPVDDAFTVLEGGAVNGSVLDNDTDPDSASHSLTAVWTWGPHDDVDGTFLFRENGTFSYLHDGSEPTEPDWFTYTVNDGTDDSVTTGRVTINVQSVNDDPEAIADAYTLDEGEDYVVNAGNGVLSNDSDEEQDELTAVLVDDPVNALSFTLNPDGSFRYTHDGSETTGDSFTYRATGGGASTATTTVTLTINPINDCPSASDISQTALEGTQPEIGLLGYDPEGDPFTYNVVDVPRYVNHRGEEVAGTYQYTGGASLTLQPDPNFIGEVTFSYKPVATGCNVQPSTAVVTITNSDQDSPIWVSGTNVARVSQTCPFTNTSGFNLWDVCSFDFTVSDAMVYDYDSLPPYTFSGNALVLDDHGEIITGEGREIYRSANPFGFTPFRNTTIAARRPGDIADSQLVEYEYQIRVHDSTSRMSQTTATGVLRVYDPPVFLEGARVTAAAYSSVDDLTVTWDRAWDPSDNITQPSFDPDRIEWQVCDASCSTCTQVLYSNPVLDGGLTDAGGFYRARIWPSPEFSSHRYDTECVEIDADPAVQSLECSWDYASSTDDFPCPTSPPFLQDGPAEDDGWCFGLDWGDSNLRAVQAVQWEYRNDLGGAAVDLAAASTYDGPAGSQLSASQEWCYFLPNITFEPEIAIASQFEVRAKVTIDGTLVTTGWQAHDLRISDLYDRLKDATAITSPSLLATHTVAQAEISSSVYLGLYRTDDGVDVVSRGPDVDSAGCAVTGTIEENTWADLAACSYDGLSGDSKAVATGFTSVSDGMASGATYLTPAATIGTLPTETIYFDLYGLGGLDIQSQYEDLRALLLPSLAYDRFIIASSDLTVLQTAETELAGIQTVFRVDEPSTFDVATLLSGPYTPDGIQVVLPQSAGNATPVLGVVGIANDVLLPATAYGLDPSPRALGELLKPEAPQPPVTAMLTDHYWSSHLLDSNSAQNWYVGNEAPISVATGDLDDDGLDDQIAAYEGTGKLSFTSDGTTTTVDFSCTTVLITESALGVDGPPTLVCISEEDVFLFAGGDDFDLNPELAINGPSMRLKSGFVTFGEAAAVGDMNLDGAADLAVSYLDGEGISRVVVLPAGEKDYDIESALELSSQHCLGFKATGYFGWSLTYVEGGGLLVGDPAYQGAAEYNQGGAVFMVTPDRDFFTEGTPACTEIPNPPSLVPGDYRRHLFGESMLTLTNADGFPDLLVSGFDRAYFLPWDKNVRGYSASDAIEVTSLSSWVPDLSCRQAPTPMNIASGDVNADGFDDLVIGYPCHDSGTEEDVGALQVFAMTELGLNLHDPYTVEFGKGNLAIRAGERRGYGTSIVLGDFDGDLGDELRAFDSEYGPSPHYYWLMDWTPAVP